MKSTFVHPYTKKTLEMDADGNLYSPEGNQRVVFMQHDGCYDFAASNPQVKEKKSVYDEHYEHWKPDQLTTAEITKPWFDDTFPWRRTMLAELGSLSGRRVLLLGNGMSYKEFYFLNLGATLVFTDLSFVAVKRAQSAFRGSELFERYRGYIEFHAVDAMHLPFLDESFDVIYGSKFAGFLDSLPDFLSEVRRCLKPGGICRFSDDAYSPAWDAVRRKIVQPIKARFLWKSMSSLDRIRSESSFGFKEESLAPFIEQFGFTRMVFVRQHFFLRIAQLFWGKIVRFDSKRLRYARPLYIILKWLDNRLEHTSWLRSNQLALTWGFDK